MDRKGPVGIGGWLAVFIVLAGIVSPLLSIVRALTASQAFTAGLSADAIIDLSHFVLNMVVHWYIIWRLLARRTWRSVPIVIVGLWLLSVGLILLKLGAQIAVFGHEWVPTSLIPWLPNLPPVIWSIIWTAYFLRSRRVANTYPRNPADSDLPHVFE